MKTMKSVLWAVPTKFEAVICSFMLATLLFTTHCFAQASVTSSPNLKNGKQRSQKVVKEELVGFYQFPNKVAFIEFNLEDGVLKARQLWDGKEYQLNQVSETNFETKQEGHKIEFLSDNDGHFTKAKLLGRIVASKVSFNPKIVRRLSDVQLKRLEGNYVLADDNNIKMQVRSVKDELIIKQLWDNKEISFTPISEPFFLNADGTFPLTFELTDGKVTKVICFENDIWKISK